MFFFCFVLNIWTKPYKTSVLGEQMLISRMWMSGKSERNGLCILRRNSPSFVSGKPNHWIVHGNSAVNDSEIVTIMVTWYKSTYDLHQPVLYLNRTFYRTSFNVFFQIAWNGIYQTVILDQDCANWSCQTTHPNCHLDNWILTVHIALVDMPKFTMDWLNVISFLWLKIDDYNRTWV